MSNRERSRRRRAAEWWRDSHWYAFAALVFVVFVLGIVGFWQLYAARGVSGATFWDATYESVQLLVLESGAVDPPAPPLLNIARFLGAFAFFYGAVAVALTIFGERIARFRLRMSKGYAVVCGLGDRGMHITERLLGEGMRVAVIDRDEHAPMLNQARAAGAVTVIGDASDVGILKKVRAERAARVYAVCQEDGDNAEIVVRLAELVADSSAKNPVVAITHIYDTELCDLLREQSALSDGPRGVEVRYFNVPERGAQAMLGAVPPNAMRENEAPHIVVVGLGKLGRCLVIEAARAWQKSRGPDLPRPRVTMIDQAAENKAELLRVRFPPIDEVCTLIPLTIPRKNAPEFERGDYLYNSSGVLDVDAVYTCPDDDVHSLAAALNIRRHTRGAGIPIAVRMRSQGGLASLLMCDDGGTFTDLCPVGVLDHACDPNVLLGPRL